MQWSVFVHVRAAKNLAKLPPKVQKVFALLLDDLKLNGPITPTWANFGKLRGHDSTWHCHLKKGNPTYVAVWWTVDAENNCIEVTYVGTHEKAPY